MQTFFADLHIHTVLSPCGDLLMTPQNIIDKALAIGLDIIAITDHNSAKNVATTVELAAPTDLTVIPGMEVETKEEVHLICLFPTVDKVLEWQEIVNNALPDVENNEEAFGPQLITNSNDEYIKKEPKLLLQATTLSVADVVAEVNKLAGLVIPAHVDKTNYSLIYNLGFINPELNILGVEISKNTSKKQAKREFEQLTEYSLLSNSDAHYLKDLQKSMKLLLSEATFSELKLAILNKQGREIDLL